MARQRAILAVRMQIDADLVCADDASDRYGMRACGHWEQRPAQSDIIDQNPIGNSQTIVTIEIEDFLRPGDFDLAL